MFKIIATLFLLCAGSVASAEEFGLDLGMLRVNCSATDRGFEEHWGGHRNCRECLREHGRCVETCSQEFFTCTYTGRINGREREFSSSDEMRRRAQNRAENRCQRSGARNCRPAGCDRDREVISRRAC